MSVKDWIADLARPFAIISTSGAAAISTVMIAMQVKDGSGGAVYMGAVFFGVGALVGVRAWENASGVKANAAVEVERAKQSPPPTEALKPSVADESERSLEDPA